MVSSEGFVTVRFYICLFNIAEFVSRYNKHGAAQI